MSTAIRDYLLAITAAAMIGALLQAVLKESALKKALMLVFGAALTLCILSPLFHADLMAFAQYISEAQLRTDAFTSGIEVRQKDLLGRVIQEKTEAYILDKAASMGCSVQVEVEIDSSAPYPYPCAVSVTGSMSAEEQSGLAAVLERELGIPAERQVFLIE